MRLEYYAATIPTAESLLLEYPGIIDPAGHTLGIEGFTMPIHLHPFSRMLAKIAHGYAIAELGYGTFEELLPDFILGRMPNSRHEAERAVPESCNEPLIQPGRT
jgi:hypothetical protein